VALTALQVRDRVFYRLSTELSESTSRVYRDEIESWIPDGLRRLGDAISKSPVQCHLLSKTFSITLTSGIGALDTAILPETIPLWGSVTGAGESFSLQWVPSLQHLELPKSTIFQYYTIHAATGGGGAIHVRKGDGSATALTSVSVKCGFYPTLAQVPDQLEDNFIDFMVEVGREKLSGAMKPVEV